VADTQLVDTNLEIKQGTDDPIEIRNVRDAAGALITNWVGYSVKAHIRERIDSTTVLHEWTSSGVAPNATFSGSDIVLALSHATTTAWTWTRGRYDVELTNPAGKVARIAQGRITISREVTR
jgi:hypothetical protein